MESEFKYELHLHTSEGSACALSSGAEMADFYKEQGFAGVFITDHFFNGNCKPSRAQSWSSWVEEFYSGYQNAKRRGEEIGLDVFFAWECSHEGADFLTYGLDKQWLLENPEIIRMSAVDYLKTVRANGGFVIHAHPFREAPYIDKITLLPYDVDAVEGFNGGHLPNIPQFNERAVWYAKSYGLPITAGTDNHRAGNVPSCTIIADHRLTGCDDFADTIKNGKFKLCLLPSDSPKK